MSITKLDLIPWLEACLNPANFFIVGGGRWAPPSQTQRYTSYRNTVFILEKGRMALQAEGSEMVLQPGDVCWCSPETERVFQNLPENRKEVVRTEIRITVLDGEERFTPVTGCQVFRARMDLLSSFAELRKLRHEPDPMGTILMRAAVVRFSRALFRHSPATGEGLSPLQKQKVLTRLNEGVPHDVSVSDLAEAAGLGQAWFRRKFKQSFGESPREYLTHQRLSLAAEMLTETTLIVKEICTAIGMKDQNLFSRLFKKHYGMTPSEFRRQHAGGRGSEFRL